MIVHTITLAVAGGTSTDPWHILGNSYSDRLAIAALADLVAAGELVAAGQKGLLKKRTVLIERHESVVASQGAQPIC